MLAGIEMPHYLSLTNMFTKFLGLICTLAAGSTVSLGKVVRPRLGVLLHNCYNEILLLFFKFV